MIQQVLLLGQVAVVLLIYLFVWRVMRTASRGLGSAGASISGQDSTIIPAAEADAARRAAGLGEPRIVVTGSDQLREGVPYVVGRGLTFGRAADNDIVLDDQFVSSHHARLVPPDTLVDLESTNGTLVNGRALRGRAQLAPGDDFRLGSTTFRYEVLR